jgi:hypothetical protein
MAISPPFNLIDLDEKILETLRFSGLLGFKDTSQEKKAMENLARYIIRASFSQDRITYFPEESRIIYRSKDNRQEKAFDALDWLVLPLAG